MPKQSSLSAEEGLGKASSIEVYKLLQTHAEQRHVYLHVTVLAHGLASDALGVCMSSL